MHRIPAFIQGHQRVAQQVVVKPSKASKQLNQKIQELRNSSGCAKTLKSKNLISVSQGVQREYIHTNGACPYGGKVAFGAAYEPWSEDMACILQGTCLPGSTRYCRTNSMFGGKLDMSDIQQGTGGNYRSFSTLTGAASVRRFHTTSRPLPIFNASKSTSPHLRNFNTATVDDRQNCQVPSSITSEAWTEDIACILQGTCLPGSTRYCRTSSMFGHHLQMADILQDQPRRYYSSSDSSSSSATTGGGQVSSKEKLKRAVRDYGSTVIVFHVCISLISLGSFYLLVSSGIDMQAVMSKIGFAQDSALAVKIASGTSTFVVAYAIHKCFVPVRMGLTLTCTPLIVRYLRGVGVLKKPLPK